MDGSKLHQDRAAQNSIRFIVSMAVLIGALLTTTFAIPALEHSGLGGAAANHGGWVADIRGFLRNPVDYFAARSPGMRGSGPLLQSKHRMFKLPRNGVKPHEQVLSNVRYGPPVPPFINDLAPYHAPGLIDISEPIPAVGGGPPGRQPGVPPPVAPVGIPGTNPGTNPSGIAVPEASTWSMLIWGMALVGFGLRWRQRNAPKARFARVSGR